MDKTAIDESDDFGLQGAQASLPIRRRVTLGTLTASLFVSVLSGAAVVFVLGATRDTDIVRLAGRLMLIATYQHLVRDVIGVSQLCCAVTGALGIILSDRWAYEKYPPGHFGRKLFEAAKWLTVIALFLVDAWFLEYVYELAFI